MSLRLLRCVFIEGEMKTVYYAYVPSSPLFEISHGVAIVNRVFALLIKV